jgi:hypothetical protein
MTQFMLVVGDRPQDLGFSCQSIDETDKFFKIAQELFTQQQLQSCWYLDNELTHELLSQARSHILAEHSIEKTIIGKLLVHLFRSCEEVVLWYSDDFSDLPEFTDVELVMPVISIDLMKLAGEIYLRFRGKIVQ